MSVSRKAPQAPQAPSQAPQSTPTTSAPAGAPSEAPKHVSASSVALLAGAQPKDFRRWLRAQARNAGAGEALPGKGGAYAIASGDVEALVKAYASSKARKGTSAPTDAIMRALRA